MRLIPNAAKLGWSGNANAIGACVLTLLLLGSPGCSTAPDPVVQASQVPTESMTIQEGDVLKISFPSARGLDTTQEVRRDGRISLATVGEVVAAGLTPSKLEQELAKLYATELVSKDVNVAVVSSTLEVIVSGAVSKPGKIVSKRPLTAFDAVMEAGGFDGAKADIKRVVVVRRDNGKVINFKLNLERVLAGTAPEPFFLKPFDVVYVPAKVVWF